MSEQSKAESAANPEEKSKGRYLFAVFVGVPLLIIAVVVAMFSLFAWLVGEKRSVGDYMAAIHSGTAEKSEQSASGLFDYIKNSKYWQTMFDMTQQVAFNREQFLQDNPGFAAQVQVAFEDKSKNVKTRRYLAAILGLVGDKSAAPALAAALQEEDPILVRNCLWALARIGGELAVSDIAPFTTSEKNGVRLMANFSMGTIRDPRVIPFLKQALADKEHPIRWNAALQLVEHGDDSGKDVILVLVKNEPQPSANGARYVDVFGRMKIEDDPNDPGLVTSEKKTACRVAAVEKLAKLGLEEHSELLRQVSLNDPDLTVRNAALRVLNPATQKEEALGQKR
jgi:hypothetical protein